MNNLSLSIVTLIHYNVAVRDTLEYAMYGRKFDPKAYEYKRNAIKVELEQATALKNFLDRNEEAKKKITELVNNLNEAIYSNDSTICHLSGEELRVDESQHIAIYDVVLPLHEEIKKIINAHMGFARSKNLLENDLIKLVVADERMYRAICFRCLYSDLNKLFVEFNKARHEAKGEVTPQSNFIQDEILKICKHIEYVIANQNATDCEYWDVVDFVNKTIQQTSGRRELPMGKTFNDTFEEGNRLINAFLGKCEARFRELYDAAIKELSTKAKENQGEIKINVQEEAAKNGAPINEEKKDN